jgi:hypothetical protein
MIRHVKIAWILKETTGVTLLDKIILLFLKIIYLAIKVSIRIVLGKKRTNRLYIKRNIGFNSFLYKFLKFLSVGNYILLKVMSQITITNSIVELTMKIIHL